MRESIYFAQSAKFTFNENSLFFWKINFSTFTLLLLIKKDRG